LAEQLPEALHELSDSMGALRRKFAEQRQQISFLQIALSIQEEACLQLAKQLEQAEGNEGLLAVPEARPAPQEPYTSSHVKSLRKTIKLMGLILWHVIRHPFTEAVVDRERGEVCVRAQNGE
jgi:hypothetical protein